MSLNYLNYIDVGASIAPALSMKERSHQPFTIKLPCFIPLYHSFKSVSIKKQSRQNFVCLL